MTSAATMTVGRPAAARRKVVLASHFPLTEVSGVTVILTEILHLWPSIAPAAEIAHFTLSDLLSGAAFEGGIGDFGQTSSVLIGINLHLEVQWQQSLELFKLCSLKGIPAYNYVHDYWAHHRDNVDELTTQHGVRLLASTDFVAGLLRRAGFDAVTVPLGVRLPDSASLRRAEGGFGVVGAAGRLSPRKRFPDIVRGFCAARTAGERLYLRLLPSLVFDPADDAAQFSVIVDEVRRAAAEGVVEIDRTVAARNDYSRYSLYVCASSYEGFSMTPIEASYWGCPPLISDIPPHRRIADTLFGDRAEDYVFPVGDTEALARLLRDELTTGRRRKFLAGRQEQIRQTIAATWSLETTVGALARLAETPAHD